MSNEKHRRNCPQDPRMLYSTQGVIESNTYKTGPRNILNSRTDLNSWTWYKPPIHTKEACTRPLLGGREWSSFYLNTLSRL